MSRPGDDPYDDAAVHKVPVIRSDVDLLLAEVIALGGRDELRRRYGLFYWAPPSFRFELGSLHPLPGPDALADELRSIRDRLEKSARNAGWEVDRLLEEARSGR